jgi:type IV pilus assembly protein PilC
MPRYAYQARSGDGTLVRGTEVATDELVLDRALAERDLLLVRSSEVSVKRSRSVRARGLVDFCFHMATIVEAGIPILQGLRDLQDDGQGALAFALENVAGRVESGASLSEALGEFPGLFPDLMRSLVAAGEETGKLGEVFRDLTVYFQWREELRRKLVAAATYPCIVVAGLIGLLTLLTTVVLPKFLGIFVELGVDLPAATRALIALQGFVETWWLHTLLGLTGCAFAAWIYIQTPPGRLHFHRLLLQIPVVGRLLFMIEVARLSHNLGLLYASGIQIVRCFSLIEPSVKNRVIRNSIIRAREDVGRGAGLAEALRRDGLLPRMVLRMVSVGEATGRLRESLDHVANYYDREVPALIDRMIALVNTTVIVLLGTTLATVALAVFVPLYRMMGSLNDAAR